MTASYQKTFPVSWEELHRTAKALAWRLIGQGPVGGQWEGIVAITRGGLVPAAIIARELDIRLIDTVCMTSYSDEHAQGEIKLLKGVPGDGTGWLIIDDLVDTFVTEVSQDTWIYFPWDIEPQFVQPIVKLKGQ